MVTKLCRKCGSQHSASGEIVGVYCGCGAIIPFDYKESTTEFINFDNIQRNFIEPFLA